MNNLFIANEINEPLNEEELIKEFKKMKNGDKTAREKIIKHNIKLVFKSAYNKNFKDEEELKEIIAVGMEALIKAVDTFNLDKNIKFNTYAFKCIENAIYYFFRKNLSKSKEINLEDIYYVNEKDDEIKIIDNIKEDTSLEEEMELKELYLEIRKIINKLDDKEKNIVLDYFGFKNGEKKKQKYISKDMNLSQSQISRILKKSLKKIKQQLIEEKYIEIIKIKSK